jgi:hypothetical protein
MTFDQACRTIEAEFAVAMGNPERVAAACAVLRESLGPGLDPDALIPLAPLLSRRSGGILRPLFDLIEDSVEWTTDPAPLLLGMLESRDEALRTRALDRLLRCVDSGRLTVGIGLVTALAELVEREGSPIRSPEALGGIDRVLRTACPEPTRPGQEPRVDLFLHGPTRAVRSLAARLLDTGGTPPPKRMETALGADAYRFLAPYLAYTQATHLDLLDLAYAGHPPRRVLDSLVRAEVVLGERHLREVITEVGWARMNLGLDVRERVGIRIGSGFPLVVSPAEAGLLESCPGAVHTWKRCLVLAHGGRTGGDSADSTPDGPVNHFRAYNLAHAEALGEILGVEPLSHERIDRIVRLMDRIVADYVHLFAEIDEEAPALPETYASLRDRVVRDPESDRPEVPSTELTRLVLMFEDPRSLGDVRTLHGLKRYLHQRGLRLGFRLVETRRATNRTVDLVLVTPERVLPAVRKIQYVDFEPDDEDETLEARIPYAARVVADGFGRHLIHGLTVFPDTKVFCYGNEVHYYASFGTHPAFLRIDFAPPARGGMIDLEYYGVSKNDLDHHPSPDLDGIRQFFRSMDYDCSVARTRVHARYDKERARDLADLCQKAEWIFRILPMLMDVDWVIGSLRLDEEARGLVARAWSDFFLRWGVLPVDQFLTRDRLGVLVGFAPDPAGEKEIAWSGRGEYRDRFSTAAPAALLPTIRTALEQRGIAMAAPFHGASERAFGQIALEQELLHPLRNAVARGELSEGPGGLEPAPLRFRRNHEAERFASILNNGFDGISKAAELADLICPIERTLRFQVTGNVNGHEVARADLELRGENAALYVLRDRDGISRLAMFAREGLLFSTRSAVGTAWRCNETMDVARVLPLIRRANYVSPGTVAPTPVDPRELRDNLASQNRRPPAPTRHGEHAVMGVRAAPGRASGFAVLGTRGSNLAAVEGAILIAATLRPEDNAFIYRAAGIVSTGGGILSHAGLLALQFHKPALLIPATWDEPAHCVRYRVVECDARVGRIGDFAFSARTNVREREERIEDGDLLDVDDGVLRILGHEPDALALHEGLRQMDQAGRAMERIDDDAYLLGVRGQRLRARHQLERLFARMADPDLARYAVRELFMGAPARGAARGEKAALVGVLLGNRKVAAAVRDCVDEVLAGLRARFAGASLEAATRIPASQDAHEILALRIDAVRLGDRLGEALSMAMASGAADGRIAECPAPVPDAAIDLAARERLAMIRSRLVAERRASTSVPDRSHLDGRIATVDLVLGPAPTDPDGDGRPGGDRGAEEEPEITRLSSLPILLRGDGGLGLAPLIGSKAANLSEVGRILGRSFVPDWFAVTATALETVLDAPVASDIGSVCLRDAIRAVLRQNEPSDAQKSFLIRKLWSGVRIPESITGAITRAYRALGEPDAVESGGPGEDPFVAVRSSGLEEDTAAAARAGEFDTFLFVRGEEGLLDAMRGAWSGLWSERAIHNRAVLGVDPVGRGGGVLVQRICWSRVSGVLTTINIGDQEMREIVISAGLGLGEGIVSGVAGADLIVVVKNEDLGENHLRFRYQTNDKREKVVYDRRRGHGTARVESLYHERFRPALEYVELLELVRAALRLERTYGHPLDIEFGIEADKVRILQARPVALTAAVLRETIDRYPLRGPRPEQGAGKEER